MAAFEYRQAIDIRDAFARDVVIALCELGFPLTDVEAAQIERGKDFVQASLATKAHA